MTKRPKGHRLGLDPHPTRDWLPDIPGHRNRNGVIVRGEQNVRNLRTRLENLIRKLRGEDTSEQNHDIKSEREL